jgi:hypothetical protein
MIIQSTFKPAWWLSNPHAQTVYPTLVRNEIVPIDKHERIELADGDFIDLAWAINGLKSNSPLIVFIHGLGGDLNSKYVSGQITAYNRAGWRAVFMHLRGASHEANRLPKAYHSGETNDLNSILQLLTQREPNTPKAIVGISLGGNILLKWLGENPNQNYIQSATAVSVPFELAQVSQRINQGFSRVYQQYLLRKLQKLYHRKLSHHLGDHRKEVNKLYAIRDFHTFDEQVTAPMHGFKSAEDYYQKSSSRQFLKLISVPTLIIHAFDDPFMTPEVIPMEHELSDSIQLELSLKGGHVGFISGNIPGKAEYWLDTRIPDFLKNFLN